jgi:hypothetical protein
VDLWAPTTPPASLGRSLSQSLTLMHFREKMEDRSGSQMVGICMGDTESMVILCFSTPTKFFPAIFKVAIRRAAATGGPLTTSDRVIAMALSEINLN